MLDPAGGSRPAHARPWRAGAAWCPAGMSACTSPRPASAASCCCVLLAGLRWWRPYSMRFKDEQARIERWLRAVDEAAQRDLGLGARRRAMRPAHQGLWRHARARPAQLRADRADLLRSLHRPACAAVLADAIGQARQAALADPEGRRWTPRWRASRPRFRRHKQQERQQSPPNDRGGSDHATSRISEGRRVGAGIDGRREAGDRTSRRRKCSGG